MLLVLALVAVIVGMGLPAMLNALNRAKLTSFAQQTAAAMQAARYEAIRRSTQSRVEVHFADNSVLAYVPCGLGFAGCAAHPAFDPNNDVMVFQGVAPRGVVLQGPGTTVNDKAVVGFATIAGGGVALFNSDGSVGSVLTSLGGAFRFRDQRGNIMEVFVSSMAGARPAVRKYTGDPNGSDQRTMYIESDEKPGWTWN